MTQELDLQTIGRAVFEQQINNGFTTTGNTSISSSGTFDLNSAATFSFKKGGLTKLRILSNAAGVTSAVDIDASTALFFPRQSTTAAAPAAVVGAVYFDTTLNKLRIGGAGPAWETVTSAP